MADPDIAFETFLGAAALLKSMDEKQFGERIHRLHAAAEEARKERELIGKAKTIEKKVKDAEAREQQAIDKLAAAETQTDSILASARAEAQATIAAANEEKTRVGTELDNQRAQLQGQIEARAVASEERSTFEQEKRRQEQAAADLAAAQKKVDEMTVDLAARLAAISLAAGAPAA